MKVQSNEIQKSRSQLQETWRRLIKNKGAVIGMIFLLLLVVAALLAGIIFNYDEQVIGQDIQNRLQWPRDRKSVV